MEENKGCSYYWGCFMWENIIKSIIFFFILIWNADEYGGLTQACHHWNNEYWWFAPIFWYFIIFLGAVAGVLLLILIAAVCYSAKKKVKQILKIDRNND